jgi:cytochrome c
MKIKYLVASSLLSLSLFQCTPKEDKQKPDESRFTPVILAQDLDEPMVFEVLKNGDVLIAERKGGVKLYDAKRDTTVLVAHLPVNTKYTNREGVVREAEEGLIGLTVDPDFEKNNWVYLYYAHPTESKHVLTRWDFVNQKLVEASMKTVLEVKTQREACCHTGGGMTWDKDGNLYLTVGNNTGNNLMAHTDERPGKESWDDQAHAANTNDLRGKILRIHPEKDGTYTIPEGNLFRKGTDKTRPEIYTMGHRNAWRVSIDSHTGYIYWGEVGPDASVDSEIGPRGYDEFNQAREPGNFGWPFFVGPNAAFPYYDFEKKTPLEPKDPNNYTNLSVNNTGLQLLPPVAPPFIYYPYGASEEFPLVGSGGRSATGGPIFRRSDFGKDAKRPFPAYYEGKWFITDLSRGWIMAVTMDEQSNYQSMEQFLPNYHPIEPIDMKFGPEGDLYVLEYGSTWFAKSPNSQLVRIEYNAGNRPPIAEAAASKTGGMIPFETTLLADGSRDPDGDKLSYQWQVVEENGAEVKTYKEANPTIKFEKEGVFTATLTVADPFGERVSKSVKIISGNATPEVAFHTSGNQTFFFPDQPFDYEVKITDEEDGSLSEGSIRPEHVAVSIQYVSEGFDLAEVIQNQRSVNMSAGLNIAQSLMAKGNCNSCHNTDKASVGPALVSISEKYKNDPSAIDRLAKKIREGGNGVWGEVMMPANPGISAADARTILNYIMHINDQTVSSLPTKGTFKPTIPDGDNGAGTYILQAGYSDRGAGNVPSHTVETIVKLRSPLLRPADRTTLTGSDLVISGSGGAARLKPKHGTVLGFTNIDLTGIRSLKLLGSATIREDNSGGSIELRAGSPTGELIGRVELPLFNPTNLAPVPTMEQAMQDAGGNKKAAEKIIDDIKAANRVKNTPPDTFLPLDKKLAGKQDLYFIFSNSAARPEQPLLTLSGIEFQK